MSGLMGEDLDPYDEPEPATSTPGPAADDDTAAVTADDTEQGQRHA